MPRLFTGLEIPPSLAAELTLMRGGLAGARWIDPENYHITLRFIGDIDLPTAREVAQGLDEIRCEAFPVVLEGLGAFGGDKPRSIVAKVQPSPALLDLQAEQERLMRRLGLPAEPRRFVPHVTLARLRGVPGIAVADYLGHRGFLSRRFTAERFVLYSARDSVGGGPYIAEEAYPFG
ncbi:RNA 2',3'-cyclic phosphodiesterase [Lichenihabitans sp. Uapishka_5]|uniref:RNA 2',3'-cyclic phosphodiesterase n=1 Tax=Lichenihabitans sp. Uapishka_5 TaxID=3037302 RepID=UPI0029E7FB4A|nr:RNA 2',3'-cyclic phosphodiesterase [Lichenihabitans sp. Uapishka_5]MDX7951609.1 RNA 2',3'-cyclic phosphodiesterase [Lichenihabitans sp. Uapishka_5]